MDKTEIYFEMQQLNRLKYSQFRVTSTCMLMYCIVLSAGDILLNCVQNVISSSFKKEFYCFIVFYDQRKASIHAKSTILITLRKK